MSAGQIVSVGNSGPVLLASVDLTGALPFTSVPMMLEARRMKKWLFSLGGTFTNGAALVQGTIDANTSGYIGEPNTPPNANWFTLPGEESQTGTGIEANPLTAITQSLTYDGTLFAVRVVVSAASGTGTLLVFGLATP